MANPKLVVVNTKTNHYAAYEGRTLVESATFSRPLFADELEAFRTNPKSLTEEDAA